MLNPAMASAFVSKTGTDTFQKLEKADPVDIDRRLVRRRSYTEKILALGADTFHQKLEKPDHVDTDCRLQRRRSFTEKILAIQSLTHPGRSAVLPPDSPRKKTLRMGVAKARVQCHGHFLNGFEKRELSEAEIVERHHALAQKLIAKTLRQSDRRRRPRRRLIFRIIRKRMILSSIMACLQWLRQPLVRFARTASLDTSKVELHQAAFRDRRNAARVTCFL